VFHKNVTWGQGSKQEIALVNLVPRGFMGKFFVKHPVVYPKREMGGRVIHPKTWLCQFQDKN
jgi:hypothetical protein